METKFPNLSDDSLLITQEQIEKIVDAIVASSLRGQDRGSSCGHALFINIPNGVGDPNSAISLQLDHSLVEFDYSFSRGDIFSLVEEVIGVKNTNNYKTVNAVTTLSDFKSFIDNKILQLGDKGNRHHHKMFLRDFDELLKELATSPTETEKVLTVGFQSDILVNEETSVFLELIEDEKVTYKIEISL